MTNTIGPRRSRVFVSVLPLRETVTSHRERFSLPERCAYVSLATEIVPPPGIAWGFPSTTVMLVGEAGGTIELDSADALGGGEALALAVAFTRSSAAIELDALGSVATPVLPELSG